MRPLTQRRLGLQAPPLRPILLGKPQGVGRGTGRREFMSSSRGNPGADEAESELLDPKHQLPAVMARNEKTVDEGFWKKMVRVAGKIPFAEEAAAAWYCARDPETPMRVRATLLAALAYFVMPVDFIPDIVAA